MNFANHNGLTLYHTDVTRLIHELTRRGWYKCKARDGIERFRMRRNGDVISVGIQGTIVASGSTARCVVQELLRSEVQL
jgi:hypothetical protein